MTRYVAEAARPDGRDVGLVLLQAQPESRRAVVRAGLLLLLLLLVRVLVVRYLLVVIPAAPAAASAVHQRPPVVGQRQYLDLEVSATRCRLKIHTF